MGPAKALQARGIKARSKCRALAERDQNRSSFTVHLPRKHKQSAYYVHGAVLGAGSSVWGKSSSNPLVSRDQGRLPAEGGQVLKKGWESARQRRGGDTFTKRSRAHKRQGASGSVSLRGA